MVDKINLANKFTQSVRNSTEEEDAQTKSSVCNPTLDGLQLAMGPFLIRFDQYTNRFGSLKRIFHQNIPMFIVIFERGHMQEEVSHVMT